MIPAWVLWLFALSGLVIASFLAFCDQRRISEKHEKDKNQALELANSHFDKDETEHTKAALRKAVKDLLGRYLKIIDGQISNIELMDWNAATEANRLKEILYWSDVSMEISVFLKERFSEAESALFKSQSDMHRTPVNDELDWPQKQRQLLLDQMTHGSKQLRSIIEKLI